MAFCLLGVAVSAGALHSVDHTLFWRVQSAAPAPVRRGMGLVSFLGAPEVTLPAMGLLCLLGRGRRRIADPTVWGPLGVMAALVLVELAAKHLVHQVPPTPVHPDDFALLRLTTPFTYPSGHMGRTTLMLGMIGTRLGGVDRRRWCVLSAVFLLLMGVARVMVGGHWPSDVAGGLLLGAAGVAAIAALPVLPRLRDSRKLVDFLGP